MTSDEILLFLVKNSMRDKFSPLDYTNDFYNEHPELVKPLHDLLLRLSGPHRYTVSVDKFVEFVGEPYSFEKHLRPLHAAGYLRFQIAPDNDFYGQEIYRKAFDTVNGLIKNYDTGDSYIAFMFKCEEDEFLTEFRNISTNADELGLREPRKSRKKLV